MERQYKGYTIARCEMVAYLCGNDLTWMVHTPQKTNVRFKTLKECKQWINSQING